MNNSVTSKEGQVVGHLGNVEVDPFPQSTLKQREGDQPLPKTNGETDCQTTMLRRFSDDITMRREVGIQRYGTALQPFNGRDAMQDVWEEGMDLMVYLEQIRRERHAMIELLRDIARYDEVSDLASLSEVISDRARILLTGMGVVL